MAMTNPNYIPHPPEVAAGFRDAGLWNDDTLADWLDGWADRAPDRICMVEPGGRHSSYAEVAERSRRFADALHAMGCGSGDVVGIQMPSCIEFLVAYFGVIRLGGVLATFHMPLGESELEPLLRFAEVSTMICAPADDRYPGPDMMRRLAERIPGFDRIVVGRGPAADPSLPDLPTMAKVGASRPAPRSRADQPALLCFTSGTSAAPKGIMRTQQSLTANARLFAPVMRLSQEDRSMTAAPMTHVFGLECVNNALLTGGGIVPLERFQPDAFATALEQVRPTVVYCAPAHLATTLKAGALDGRDLGAIRQVIVGGAICPPHVAEAFEARLPNGEVGNLFGMTEVLIATQTRIGTPRSARHETVGPPIPGVEARIVGQSGAPVGDGEEGELQLRGCCVMAGYLKNDAANAEAKTSDGWFRTGDLATWREDCVAITGRLTDVINRGGIKINPTDVENAISQHASVVHAALVPMPDDVLGERICAVVTLLPGHALELAELTAFLEAQGITKMRWPERLLVIDEMPMTPTRKISKGQLRRLIESAGPA